MLGLSSIPISAIPPLNTIPTRAHLFANCSFSPVTNCTRACAARACACSSSSSSTTTTTTRSRTTTPPSRSGVAFRHNPRAKIATATATAIAIFITTKTANHALRLLHPLQFTIGRIASACIEDTIAVRAKAKDASANPRYTTLSQQPSYPGASPDLQRPVAAAAAAAARLPQSPPSSLPHHYDPKDYYLQSPFRNRAASSAARRLPHLSAARLWNPTNSTPRLPDKPVRKRRPSTPPPPAVPLSHPTLGPSSINPADPLGIGAGDYPLLTLPEQRQTRHSTSTRASLQVDRSGNAEHRISLPPSLRHSYDGRRSADPSPTVPDFDAGTAADKEGTNPLVRDFAITFDTDKGKEKAAMEQRTESQTRGTSKDLERGPEVLPRYSNASAGDGIGIGSAISSSNSSIMGEELPPDMGEEWGPQHPCFPHLNPHVPLDSLEYRNTRIIRVRRDWLIEGDLAPTFSNLYPEILDPAGLSEQEFRRIIDKLNGELIPIFSPYSWRNVMDGLLGLVTGWLWDDLGFTGVKARLDRLERWIDQWNTEMEKTVGNEDSSMAPRIISLRKTGYMTLDIQIPDPEIAPAPSTPGGSRSEGMPMEPPPVAVA
ncbi:Golgin subfamily A member 7/ERF4 family-domain-containing protein [Colletotrichum cereale]|nr:Golgin subfamily A member 7/ERF4 family-domain-containing protein [Colletotrichum cereale]